MERSYRISMLTPLGPRIGKLLLTQRGSDASGFIEVLGGRHYYHGAVETVGGCRLWGKLVTLVCTIEFNAKGTVGEDAVELVLTGGRDVLPLSGVAYKPREREKDEKIL